MKYVRSLYLQKLYFQFILNLFTSFDMASFIYVFLGHLCWRINKGYSKNSKGMGAIFQKEGKEMLKKDQILENWAKTNKTWKYFEKRQVIACDNRAQKTARMGRD